MDSSFRLLRLCEADFFSVHIQSAVGDTRSDVYILGVILFYLFGRKYPDDDRGSALEVMKRISELTRKAERKLPVAGFKGVALPLL